MPDWLRRIGPDGWRFKSRVHVWEEIGWTDDPVDMPVRNIADE